MKLILWLRIINLIIAFIALFAIMKLMAITMRWKIRWSYKLWKEERKLFLEDRKRGVPYYQNKSKWWTYGWFE